MKPGGPHLSSTTCPHQAPRDCHASKDACSGGLWVPPRAAERGMSGAGGGGGAGVGAGSSCADSGGAAGSGATVDGEGAVGVCERRSLSRSPTSPHRRASKSSRPTVMPRCANEGSRARKGHTISLPLRPNGRVDAKLILEAPATNGAMPLVRERSETKTRRMSLV